MGLFWTDIFANAVNNGASVTGGSVTVKAMLLARSPFIGGSTIQGITTGADLRQELRSVTTKASLLDLPGWVEISNYTMPQFSCNVYNLNNNSYMTVSYSESIKSVTMTGESQVQALVFLVDGTKLGLSAGDRVVFGTTSLFEGQGIVFNDGDALSALVDSSLDQRWLFGWSKDADGDLVNVADGTLTLQLNSPNFESTRLQHVWLYPQRINYIANPSFEYDRTYTVSSGSATVVAFDATTTDGKVRNAAATGQAFNAAIPDDRPNAGFGTGLSYDAQCVTRVTEQPTGVGQALNATIPTRASSVKHWQTNSAPLVPVVTGGPSDPSPMAAAVYPARNSSLLPQYDIDSRIYIKSSTFFPQGRTFTFHFKAKGTGVVRTAIAWHSRSYLEYAADWGLKDDLLFQEWQLSSDHYTDIVGIRNIDDTGYEAALLIEVRGILSDPDDPDTFVPPQVIIDNCLVEEGTLLDWPYFDGDSTYGADGDYGWYGTDGTGRSYSYWYNNKNAIAGRLFGRRVDDTALYTSQDEQLDSMLSSWSPAGTAIIPHWGSLYPNDTQMLPIDKSSIPLVVEAWPELSQPFDLYEVIDLTPTSASVLVYGEGGHPVSRAYVYTEQTGAITPVTIGDREWDAPGLIQSEIDNLRSELFDLSQAQRIDLTWAPVSAFYTNTLYLERGDSSSPQSFLSIPILAAAGSGIALATGTSYDADIPAYTGVDAGTGSVTAYGATMQVGPIAETAAATGTVNSTANTSTTTVGFAAATGAADNALADIMVQQNANAVDASAVGTAADAGNDVQTSVTTGIASSIAYDGDPTAPPVITSFKPETAYGQMTVRWTYPAAGDLVSATVEWSTNGGSTWVTDGTYTNPAGGSTGVKSRTYTEPTTSTTITVRVNVTDGQGITRSSSNSTYTIVPSPIVVSAASTNNWRNTNSGEWNNTGNSSPYQGQFSSGANYNYRGFWFYSGTAFTGTGTTGLKYAGRTITSASIRLARAGDSGINAGRTPILYGHALASNPGTVTNYGTPALQGTAQNTGLSLAYNGVGNYTLPASWITNLTSGTWKGIAAHNVNAVPASTDTSSDYMRFDNLTEDSASGQISFNHLG